MAVSIPSAPASALSVDEAFKHSLALYQAGNAVQSRAVLEQILRQRPNHAPSLHLMGVIAHQAGDTELGARYVEQALASDAGDPQYACNLGEMYRRLGQLDKAVSHGKQAVAQAPDMAVGHANLGVAYYELGDLDKAEACQRAALALAPTLVTALNNLGSIRRDRNDPEGALAHYRAVLKLDPHNLESANNLGSVLTENEQPHEALRVLLPLVKRRPDYAEAHCNVANAFLALERFDKAAFGFRRTLALNPDNDKAHLGLARVLQERRDLDGALQAAKRALALAKNKAQPYSVLGGIYMEQGFADKAKACFDAAIAYDPDLAPPYLGRGQLLLENGDLAGAKAAFLHARSLGEGKDGGGIGAQLALVNADKVRDGDADMADLVAEARKLPDLPDSKAIPLLFALGKCYDDTKQYDLAFEHYARGCERQRKRVSYSADHTDLVGQNIREFFSKETLERLRDGGCASDLPIFVLGMPRSGTTLTETILASHSQVFGAGELDDLLRLASRGHADSDAGYPLSLQGITAHDLARLGERYVAGLQARSPHSPRITDKMPANFQVLGLIHLMLPNAKIIHVRRNAVDTCLSCFTRLFNKSQHHSYDLRELGRYYRNYARLMDHWRAVLPAGAFHEVQYEDLIADQEGQARKLLDYCGLNWEDACLDFHKTERSVRTASITQVRQPIYRTSVERWRNYERHLGPLLEELGELAYA